MTTRLSLALQGGGAHGAFTWGVLDRLLEEEAIEIAAISGTSAGALNGAALKAGMIAGGRAGARTSLAALWAQVANVGDFRMARWMQPFWTASRAMSDVVETAFPVSPQGIAAQLWSPYGWGPFWENPLEPVVRRLDFSQVCHSEGPRLFIGATNLRTGRIRIFQGDEITPEALLASACLPSVFQAVTIGADAYWDGGYSGNPALFPLYEPDLPDDIAIVSINPWLRDEVPKTPLDIQNRVNEISFHAALLGELRAVNFVKRLIAEGRMERGRMKDVLLHLIADDAVMTALSASTKLSPDPALITTLCAAGRAACDGFLQRHRADLGRRASLDLAALFG
ncbi:patatin-like phospholipase family protein [Rhodobacter sp. HX-7-19]|uniref:Patatin-like phospholipase family protein n=1 Tax=Paragemmobacter kunshanensis TaxID=2583234 RepID=A0A6M1U3N7_9RHOB|nr:patatin-like phospholipase family protein [Rhodobacter kunshanensis]NGQ90795.1 patatin-like phospholipase family protein [Rhodobacter kunshanensis]